MARISAPRWILAIGPDHAAYRAAKDEYLREAGFPTRPVSGHMTFKVSGPHDYQDFMLGLRELPVVAFEATTTRWGVPLPLELSSVPISVSIRPVPKDVEVIWRRPGSFAQIRLPMKAAAMAPSSGENFVSSASAGGLLR